MQVSLSIIRYRKRFILFAFLAMVIYRIPLSFNSRIHFYKLLGCGKNGTFDKVPDLQQWAILAIHSSPFKINDLKPVDSTNDLYLKDLYGAFIFKWLRLLKCEIWTVFLEPVEGHGLWDGKRVFGDLPKHSDHEGMIAILTRATIRLSKLNYFWRHVAPVANDMKTAPGFITSAGIGEIPWIKQATFSIWENKKAMIAFAYGTKTHTEVIKKTRDQRWYSEEMFTRFKITAIAGTIRGKDPLKGKL